MDVGILNVSLSRIMKILLFYPGSIKCNENDFFYPLSIATLSGYLKSSGLVVEQVDLPIEWYSSTDLLKNNLIGSGCLSELFNVQIGGLINNGLDKRSFDTDIKRLLKKINILSFDLVGFSLFGKFSLPLALNLAKNIKRINGKIKIVFGGPLISSLNKELLENFDYLDYLISGDGELGLKLLIDKINTENKDFSGIHGLFYRKGKQIYSNRKWLNNFQKVSRPDFDSGIVNKYRQYYANKYASKYLILPYQISKGCVSKCNFCTVYNNLTIKDAETVYKELKCITIEHNNQWFFFVDNSINNSIKYLKNFCERLISKKLKVLWFAQARPENLDKELINIMYKAGCRALIYGVESGSQRQLGLMSKKTKIKEIEEVLRISNQRGILNFVSLIVGYPYESENDFMETLKFIHRNSKRISSIVFMPFTLVKNCSLYDRPKEHGIKILKQNSTIKDIICNHNSFGFNEIHGLNWIEKKNQQTERLNILRSFIESNGIPIGERFEEIPIKVMKNR